MVAPATGHRTNTEGAGGYNRAGTPAKNKFGFTKAGSPDTSTKKSASKATKAMALGPAGAKFGEGFVTIGQLGMGIKSLAMNETQYNQCIMRSNP
jgi:hypothetical protein